MLSPERFELCHWRAGERTRLLGEEFWVRVASYMEFIGREPRVGAFGLIVSRTSPDMMALFIAMIASGRKTSFFPPNATIQDQTHYFHQQREALSRIDADSILMFDEQTAATVALMGSRLRAHAVHIAEVSEEGGASGASAVQAFRRTLLAPERELFVQHSSGTTGIKKAVTITNGALLAQLDAYWPEVVRLAGPDVRVATWLPLYHDMGLLAGFLLPLLAGAAVSAVDPFEWVERPASFFELIEQDRCNISWMPNFAFRHFIRLRAALPQVTLASMRGWVNCSEPCRLVDALDFEAAFQGHGVRADSVLGCYAMAESVFAISQLLPSERLALLVPRHMSIGQDVRAAGARIVTGPSPSHAGMSQILSSGRAVASAEVAVLVNDEPVSGEGIYGELAVRGPCVFRHYHGLTAAQSNITSDGFFRTGDLGTIIDNHVFVFGRLKEIIIVNGRNLYATDVEDVINSVAGVRKGRVVAFGVESDRTGSEQLVVVAECDPLEQIPAARLRSDISQIVFDNFLVTPRDIRLVKERWLVKSTSGKVSRIENKLKYIETFQGG